MIPEMRKPTKSRLAQVVYDYLPAAMVLIDETHATRPPWWAFWWESTEPRVDLTIVIKNPIVHDEMMRLYNDLQETRAIGIYLRVHVRVAERGGKEPLIIEGHKNPKENAVPRVR